MGDTGERTVLGRLEGALRGEHRGTLLRVPGGASAEAVVAALAKANASEGACLVVVPVGVRQDLYDRLSSGNQGIMVGEWGDGTLVEMASPLHAASRAAERSPDHFACILFEECHAANARQLAAVAKHFSGARYVEVSRMPPPHPGNLPAEVELELYDGADEGPDGPGL